MWIHASPSPPPTFLLLHFFISSHLFWCIHYQVGTRAQYSMCHVCDGVEMVWASGCRSWTPGFLLCHEECVRGPRPHLAFLKKNSFHKILFCRFAFGFWELLPHNFAPIPPTGTAHFLWTQPSLSLKGKMPDSAPLCWGGIGGQKYGHCAGQNPHHPLHHRTATTTLPRWDGHSPQPCRWAKTLTPPQRSTIEASSLTTTMWLKVRMKLPCVYML